MVYNQECVTCKFLQACSKTSGQKVLSHYVCENFEQVPEEEQVVKARCEIINKFGNAGLRVLAPYAEEKA